MIRNLAIAALVLSCTAAPTAWARNYQNLTRAQIRQMPILERPSRPGHFYGNAVRRSHARQMEQVPQRNTWQVSDAPQMGSSSFDEEVTTQATDR
jgi:hypothetical protein